MGRMTASIELACEGLRCQIAPALGGCIAGLWLGDVPVLRSTPAAQLATARQAGSYPLVPFSNRMGTPRCSGRAPAIRWCATTATSRMPSTAWAGSGPGRCWTPMTAWRCCRTSTAPTHAWPFAFDASQTFRIAPGSLELTLSVTNQAEPARRRWA
jgi:aldose 1-epimerase